MKYFRNWSLKLHRKISVNGIVDLFEALGGSNLTMPKMIGDGCHPNDNGYELIAETIYREIFATIYYASCKTSMVISKERATQFVDLKRQMRNREISEWYIINSYNFILFSALFLNKLDSWI